MKNLVEFLISKTRRITGITKPLQGCFLSEPVQRFTTLIFITCFQINSQVLPKYGETRIRREKV